MKITSTRLLSCLTATILLSFTISANPKPASTGLKSIPVSQVRLTESPFKHAQDMDICYIMGLDPDRLLAPYLKEAGLQPKAPNYGNWENTGLDGHIGGHYLSALSYMYAATGNKEIKQRLDYMLDELEKCQDDASGYLCGVPGGKEMWQQIKNGDIRPGRFDLNGRWVPLYNIHKIYAGLRDAYVQTGSQKAKQMLIRLTDWMVDLVSRLDDEQIQQMLYSEHGGLNETFADVAAITGDKRYLTLACKFSDNEILQPLLQHQDKLAGMHANTQIPKVIGIKRIAELENRAEWAEAARFFWETVVSNRSITIGGNSVCEHFHPADDFTSMLESEQGPETCNTYNMLRLTKMMYESSANVSYIDYYERALYNHILSSQNPVQGGFVYFTPMRSGHYRVYSQPQTSFWCCVGSGLENHAKYGEMIYATDPTADALYVNLFIPSTVKWGDTEVTQQTLFPDEESTTITVNPTGGKKKFTLCFRLPEWANRDEIALKVNGISHPLEISDGYIRLTRTWTKADSVTLNLPMHLRAIRLPDRSANYSMLYGPIVLAAELGKQQQDGLFADDSRGGHIANGPRIPLQEMPMLVGDTADILSHLAKSPDRPLTFTLSGVYPEKFEGMTLRPFFRLYECRYMVYWSAITEAELNSRIARLTEAEEIRAKLDAVTTDKVVCGEQQPENDHFIEMSESRTDDDHGRHWRETDDWFAYRMKTGEKRAEKLVVIFRPEADRNARIEIDGTEIATLAATPSTDATATAEFPLPDSLRSLDTLTVKILTSDGKPTPHIYELRLVSQ